MTIHPLHLLAQQGSFWLPSSGSTSAQNHDVVFYTVYYVTTFFFLLVVSLMLFFIVRYRRRAGRPRQHAPTHNTPLEIAWTAIPLVIVIVFFVMGFKGYLGLEQPPTNAITIEVEARQWSFNFVYPNGGTSPHLYVPVNQPVRLLMRSADVTHSFYVPAFRIGRNIVPGRTTEIWFQPTSIPPADSDGDTAFVLFCTQYCGDGHSQMASPNHKVIVMDPASWDAKLRELANIFTDPATKQRRPWAEVGQQLYRTSGCSQCHSVDGSPGTGPSWLGLYKKSHQFSASNVPGFALSPADPDEKWDAYLRESILVPSAKIVAGYQNVMPAYAGQFSGSPYKDEKLTAIIEYLKSLDSSGGPGGTPRFYRPRPLPASTTRPAAQPAAAPAVSTTPAGKQ